MTQVAPDGSPVDVYAALPAGEAPALIDAAIGEPASILELGSGPGRITGPLVARGHRLTAVDESPEMLAHVAGAETVLADLFSLDLGRQFDAVVAASHLINAPDAGRRRALLDVCRRHLRPSGVALVERYEPGWAAAPVARTATVGPVLIDFEPLAVANGAFRGRVRYTLGERSWVQEFEAAAVTDHMLASEAEAAGLELRGWLDEARTWARLTPAPGRPAQPASSPST